MAKKVKVPGFLKAPKVKKSVKKPMKEPPVHEGDDVETVNRLATSVPTPVVPKVEDDHKVREADLKRSIDKMVEESHSYDEAVVAAGFPLTGYNVRRVALIAAVAADGPSGKVGWVTARRIDAVLHGKEK